MQSVIFVVSNKFLREIILTDKLRKFKGARIKQNKFFFIFYLEMIDRSYGRLSRLAISCTLNIKDFI